MNCQTLLSTAYLPPIEHVAFLIRGGARIDATEPYHKQSYRNRAYILTGNGIQALTVPVIHFAGKTPIREAHIDYRTPWQRNHWRTIESAYGNSPYFLYYSDPLKPFYEAHFDLLFDFNLQLIRTILRMLRLTADIFLNEDPNLHPELDLRETIHPKRGFQKDYPYTLHQPYRQVFDDRFGFSPNLSILDLIFNAGPDTPAYLKAFHEHYTSRP